MATGSARVALLAAVVLTPAVALTADAPTTRPATAPATRPTLPKANTDLHNAIVKGDVEAVRRLLDAGAPVNTSGGSPLALAALTGNLEVAKLLLARGADPDSRYHHDCPSLYCATYGRNLELMKLLLDAGAKEGLDRSLDRVTSEGVVEAMQLLIRAGANPNGTRGGQTLLHRAAKRSSAEAVRALLDAGADPAARDEDGRTPADLARPKRPEVADLIAGFKREPEPKR